MGALSANTLFHFTRTKENLINILRNDFHVRYSPENFHYYENNKAAIPMVCFCDIPLAQIKDHVDEFGSYALGLKKEWGIDKGISPVIYTLKNTFLDSCLRDMYVKCHIDKDDPSLTVEERDQLLEDSFKFFRLSSFIKEYEGVSRKTEKPKRFYDEREWRYILPTELMKDYSRLLDYEFENAEFLKAYNDDIAKYHRLEFVPNDISYIIVEKESEILETIDLVQTIKERFTENEKKLLTTRIISMERIKEDF